MGTGGGGPKPLKYADFMAEECVQQLTVRLSVSVFGEDSKYDCDDNDFDIKTEIATQPPPQPTTRIPAPSSTVTSGAFELLQHTVGSDVIFDDAHEFVYGNEDNDDAHFKAAFDAIAANEPQLATIEIAANEFVTTTNAQMDTSDAAVVNSTPSTSTVDDRSTPAQRSLVEGDAGDDKATVKLWQKYSATMLRKAPNPLLSSRKRKAADDSAHVKARALKEAVDVALAAQQQRDEIHSLNVQRAKIEVERAKVDAERAKIGNDIAREAAQMAREEHALKMETLYVELARKKIRLAKEQQQQENKNRQTRAESDSGSSNVSSDGSESDDGYDRDIDFNTFPNSKNNSPSGRLI